MQHLARHSPPVACQTRKGNARIGARYLASAAVCLAAAGTMHGLAWTLAYPAVSLFLVAVAYASGHTRFLKKTGGRWPVTTVLIFAPYLIGAWCAWRCNMRALPPWTEIVPGIVLGRRLVAGEAHRLLACGEIAVVDLAPELPECGLLTGQDYTHFPMLDLVPPTAVQLNEALRILQSRVDSGKPVFIHCTLGLYRGPLVLATWLARNGMSREGAVELIHRLRPQVVIDVLDL